MIWRAVVHKLLVTGRYSVQISVVKVAGVVSVTTRQDSVLEPTLIPVNCSAGLLAIALARLIRGSVARSIENAGLTLGFRATKLTASHSCRR